MVATSRDNSTESKSTLIWEYFNPYILDTEATDELPSSQKTISVRTLQ